MSRWPQWWEWELELSPHLLKRMLDRGFSEADLRTMMECATACSPAVDPERWIIDTTHNSLPWQVIVEPDGIDELLVVITAYSVKS